MHHSGWVWVLEIKKRTKLGRFGKTRIEFDSLASQMYSLMHMMMHVNNEETVCKHVIQKDKNKKVACEAN